MIPRVQCVNCGQKLRADLALLRDGLFFCSEPCARLHHVHPPAPRLR